MEAATSPSRDECILYLISCFRARIKSSVQVNRVLDLMPSLSLDQKRQLRAIVVEKNKQGNKSAVREMLCRIIQKKEWLSPFLEALGEAGHANMAAYISGHPNEQGVNGASDSTNEMYEAPDSEAVENLQPRTELQEALEDEKNVAEKSFEDPTAIS
ncbi:hypothetical protein E2320_020369, partial [Naja naja]